MNYKRKIFELRKMKKGLGKRRKSSIFFGK